jgi:O-antigen/teichoic acid export membrane protein
VEPVSPSVDKELLGSVLAFGLKLQLGFVVWFLLLRLDVFLVGAYLGAREVGIYSLAVLFAELVWLVTNPLVQAALPFQAEVSIRESAPLAFKVVRFNIALAVLFAGAFAAVSWFVIPRLYGSEFGESYETLVLLLPGVVAMAAARPLSLLLTRQERPLVYSAVACAGLVANVALNVLLLPSLGVVGASVASSVAYVGVSAAWIAWALRASRTSLREAFAPRASDVQTIRDAWRARGLSRTAATG